MDELIEYTPSQAIRAVKGLYRRKIYQMIKNGEISCSGGKGQKLINASELARVFGGDFIPLSRDEALLTSEKEHEEQGADEKENMGNAIKNTVFQLENQQLHERISDKERMIAMLQEQVADIQKDRDHWRQQATYLLEDKSKRKEEQQEQRETPKRSWWKLW